MSADASASLIAASAQRQELSRQGVLHADETAVAMRKPGHGKTHRAYLWSYCTIALAVAEPSGIFCLCSFIQWFNASQAEWRPNSGRR